ncbi:MAG: FAD:protein FMN transferase [Treponema sp.]|jgi:thiamine biosynthesis lipoprotein|nr:FAD:protein FMN transferase [Treponema sp.]
MDLIARRSPAALIFIAALFLPAACGGPAPPGARSEYVLGTFCRIDLYESGSAALYDRLFTRLAALDRIFSVHRDDSETAAVNRGAGIAPVRISPELFAVLERALHFAEASGGAFDPTLGPLVRLWGIGTEHPRVPGDDEIRAALELTGWRDLILSGGSAFLARPGMALDLGAIAKGYAADELILILRETEVPRAIIDLGGNIYAWGNRAGTAANPRLTAGTGVPWRIGIQDPLEDRGIYAGILELSGAAAVTSGIYERYFTGPGGRRYHHIMDPATGRPAERTPDLLSVTLTALSAADADALSTACFVLGYEKGAALAEASGAKAVFIFADRTAAGSRGALDHFTPNGPFRLRAGQ